MDSYEKGAREVMRWLTGYGIRLTDIESRGMDRDGDGWEHFAWTLTVENRYTDEKMVFPFRQGLANMVEPTLVDLMGCLLSDASCVLDRDFSEFCDDIGYDSDSRKAEKTYNEILENNVLLAKLFRTTDLAGVLEKFEPLREKAGL